MTSWWHLFLLSSGLINTWRAFMSATIIATCCFFLFEKASCFVSFWGFNLLNTLLVFLLLSVRKTKTQPLKNLVFHNIWSFQAIYRHNVGCPKLLKTLHNVCMCVYLQWYLKRPVEPGRSLFVAMAVNAASRMKIVAAQSVHSAPSASVAVSGGIRWSASCSCSVAVRHLVVRQGQAGYLRAGRDRMVQTSVMAAVVQHCSL